MKYTILYKPMILFDEWLMELTGYGVMGDEEVLEDLKSKIEVIEECSGGDSDDSCWEFCKSLNINLFNDYF